MNDLNDINRLNQASVTATAIKAARAAGKFVVAHYEGQHLVGHSEAASGRDADSIKAVLERGAEAGQTFRLLAPTALPQAA